jgi:hypothetical protein
MKATIDIPDALYRQVKARAALQGRAIRDVTIELFEVWLAAGMAVSDRERLTAAEAWLERWDDLGGRIAERAVDPRSTREILVSDRR